MEGREGERGMEEPCLVKSDSEEENVTRRKGE